MGHYILRRMIEGLITLWLISVAVFFLLRISGANPVEYFLPPEASQADVERLTKAYGFDKPLITQYWIYNKKLFRGDMGDAIGFDHKPAVEVVMGRVPATLELTATALFIAIVLGVLLGVVSAARPDSILDRVGKVIAILGQSLPVFWVGLLMILLFTVQLGWLPSIGGFDRLGWKGIVMPAMSLGMFLVAAHMRIVRSTMMEVLESDYIKMVRAKGLPARMVIGKHAFKNASIPVFTLFFVNFAALMSGAVITETIFGWPGMGRLLVDAIFLKDFPVAQTVILFVAIFIVFINILVDIMYAWLDPRIRVA